MNVVREWSALPDDGRRRFAALGTFDGVHRGHRELVRRMVEDARRAGAMSLAVTFDPHPSAVLRPDAAPRLLTTVEERTERLLALGVEAVVVRRFDRAFASIPAEAYVRGELCGEARLARVYVGFNFTFGQGGRGRPEDLARWGREACGLDVVVLEPVRPEGSPPDAPAWSSTLARRAIAEGDLDLAAACLGRPYSVRGVVEHGDARGRELGFPTANLRVDAARAMPPPGIYAGIATVGGIRRPAAISWGRRPTFGGGDLCLEVHLLDFSGDLYGQVMDVAFVRRLRDERAFASVGELVEQMRSDVEDARRAVESL